MCGICGFLGDPSAEADLRAAVLGMADTLTHRGPDAFGAWVDAASGVALGHRRLSIQDLSAEGAQPMTSACGRYVLSYNGEVYDFRELRRELEALGHKFRGHSDTEVLVEAIAQWGSEAAARRCNGMFAFAVWDTRERELTLVRDRVGKKPLYYGWSGRGIFFASELKALRAHPAFRGEVDRDALALLVQYSYIPAPHSIFAGVRKLPAGTLVTLKPGARPADAEPRAYWSARDVFERGANDPYAGSDAEATDALQALLLDAVERRMISDVPLGGLLSGGVDSTTIVALMQAASPRPVRTFSIGFHEPGYDEAVHAREVAAHLGTEHRELYVTAQDAMDVIPRLPVLYDEPFADTSQLPTFLVARLAREDVTVVLSGDGGDESFAGYHRYFRCLERWRWLARLPAPLRHAVARAMEGRGGRLDRISESFAANGLRDLFVRMNARCPDPRRFVLGAGSPATLLHDAGRWPDLPDLPWMAYMDLAGNLAEDILVKVDRASMGVSLEVRCPLLDHRVIEFAARLPVELKVRGGERKWLLRRVMDRYVPTSLTARPKMGFGMPIGVWLRGALREWAESLLDPPRLREEGYLDPVAVAEVWREHLEGGRDRRFLLWNLLSFQAWLDAAK